MIKWKYVFPSILVIYFVAQFVFSTVQIFKVDTSRIAYENLKDGPLLLKPGKVIKKGNVIQAIGYGGLTVFDKKSKKTKNEKPYISLAGIAKKKVVEAAASLLNSTDDDGFLYISMINSAYERLTMNWICNTALMKNVHSRTLIISMDSSTCQNIFEQWDDSIKCVSLNVSNYNGSYDWGAQKYINLLTLRASIMLELTTNNIPYILFETDAIWFKDPFELFQNCTNNSIDDFDIYVPIKGRSGGKSDILSFDPMFVQPTNTSKMFLKEMTKRLENNTKLYDQDEMNKMCSSQYNGLVCRVFDYDNISDGIWFSNSSSISNSLFIVNNNFNSGIKNKETRQSLNGYWFLASRSNQCKIAKVEHFMNKN